MGWFSRVGSFISSVASDVVSGVADAVQRGWNRAKTAAVGAVVWLSDKAEQFVGDVKEMWAKVKPYVSTVRAALQKLGATAPFPWLKAAALGLDKFLGAVQALENSPLAKKLEEAIKWAIVTARKLKETFLTKAEAAEAEARKATLHEAAQHVAPEQRHTLQLIALVNDYVLVQSGIKNLLDGAGVDDFEHYLRLRATQKLLGHIEKLLLTAQSLTDITEDDIFLVRMGAALLAERPELSDADALRLDGIVERLYGKKLIPFVFEEMIVVWDQQWAAGEQQWSAENKRVAKDRSLMRRLAMEQRLAPLSDEDVATLAELTLSVPAQTAALEGNGERQRYLKKCVGAAEGFLQMLEQDAAELEAAGKGYLAEQGARVGMLIIDCVQHGKPWNALTREEQDLLTDFANIFEEASQARARRLVTVEVA